MSGTAALASACEVTQAPRFGEALKGLRRSGAHPRSQSELRAQRGPEYKWCVEGYGTTSARPARDGLRARNGKQTGRVQPKRQMTDLLVRYSDRLFSVGDVIARHQAVISEFGSVWFGKFGQPIGRTTAERLERLRSSDGPYLYLAQRHDQGMDVFQAPILRFTFTPPSERKLVPSYYEELNLTRLMRSWIKVGAIRPTSPSTLDELVVVSSGNTGRDALRRSMSGAFIVERRRSASRLAS